MMAQRMCDSLCLVLGGLILYSTQVAVSGNIECHDHKHRCTDCTEWSDFGPIVQYVFAQQHAPSICYVNGGLSESCCYPPNITTSGWSIHGLWPSTQNRSDHNYCYDESAVFNTDVMEPLLPRMVAEWTNSKACEGSKFYCFWAHEWCKHGTLATSRSGEMDTQYKYFSAVLSLFTEERYNVAKLLEKENITACNCTYPFQQFEDALERALSVKPIIYCENITELENEKLLSQQSPRSTPSRRRGVQVVTSVYICLDTSYSAIRCLGEKDGNCDKSKDVYYISPYRGQALP